jgi:hypothetical protein
MMVCMIITPTLIIAGIVGLAVILLLIWVFILDRRITKLMAGKSGATLEDTIMANQEALAEFGRFRKAIEEELGRVNGRIKKKIHGAKTLRFNPFQGTGSGGNQSFATALLDEEGSGVVISSLYSRDKVSVFAKPIVNRTSEFELTEEEREVLKNSN